MISTNKKFNIKKCIKAFQNNNIENGLMNADE